MNNQINNGIVRIPKVVPGFMDCLLEHTVSSTSGRLTFTVPIPAAEWHKVLAFFKWSFDTYKSETQVRMYVNPTARTWKAWAFPQKANTGMTAIELGDHERFAVQRAQFPDPEWLYFATVHHHCMAGAFQSGTDESNEKGIPGLHITVGHMDRAVYDLHARLYLDGVKFIPDLNGFWDVGDYKALIPQFPPWLEVKVPDAAVMALNQMKQPAPAGTEFPPEWKENIITPPPPVFVPKTEYNGGLGYNPNGTSYVGDFRKTMMERCCPPAEWDLKKAERMLEGYLPKIIKDLRPEMIEVITMLRRLEELMDDTDMEFMDICCKADVLPGHLAMFLEASLTAAKKGEIADEIEEELDVLAGGTCPECGYPPGHHSMNCEIIQKTYDA